MPKSEDKYVDKIELHFSEVYSFQNLYFSAQVETVGIRLKFLECGRR